MADATPAPTSSVLALRREKREKLGQAGRDPHPAAVSRTHSLREVRHWWEALQPNTTTAEVVTVAGRVMHFRTSGKIAFATLQEGDGTRLQLMLTARELGRAFLGLSEVQLQLSDSSAEEAVLVGRRLIKEFDRLVDLGDFISATGVVCTSVRGELSVLVSEWAMASKSLRPLPFLHADLSDELRARQPELELIQSQAARDRVRLRSRLLRELRAYFHCQDFLEVETPTLQAVHGGAQARPFTTHVNALGQDFSLRIALELPLKRAVVGGLERVFEIGRVYRNEGLDGSHSPEFSLLEAYEAYGDMYSMAHRTEELLLRLCTSLTGDSRFTLPDATAVDFSQPFAWVSVYDAVGAALGVELTSTTDLETLRSLSAPHLSVDPAWSAGKIVMELCGTLVEPHLLQPTFLFDWPAEAQPLARRDTSDPARVLAWDLIIGGRELGTAFTELVDPVEQRRVLEEQAAASGALLPEEFLTALEYGMPPSGGLGLGVDRLVMLFAGCNMREAVLFPLLRRED